MCLTTFLLSFNPVANTLMGKCLQRIVARHSLPGLSQATLDGIVHSARGDLRHAITSLQFLSTFTIPPSATFQSNGMASDVAGGDSNFIRQNRVASLEDEFFFGASAPSSGAASGAAVAMEYSSKSQCSGVTVKLRTLAAPGS